MTTIQDVLAEYERIAPDQRAKGLYFERLVKRYFESEPTYLAEFERVWLWNEWPGRGNRPDTGIDLVAERTNGNGLAAIQCKFYAATNTVDKPAIDSFISASNRAEFTDRIVVSTTERWTKNALDTLDGLTPPIRRIGLTNLAESVIDWSSYRLTDAEHAVVKERNSLRPHQIEALQSVLDGFDEHDRGQLIMACGTGKTMTSLRIAERVAGRGGSVLFLVPSIALLAQTLREWSQQANEPLRSFAICSDGKVGKDSEDLRIRDLEIPATTSAEALRASLAQSAGRSSGAMTVFFSTYQSIAVVHEAQQTGAVGEFDLVICDEAHRTAGTTLAGEEASEFVRVHDADYLRAAKRLYMTATPKLFAESAKKKAIDGGVEVASMNDPETFGPEFHRLGFGKAVEADLLSDYKVLVLAVSESAVTEGFQKQFATTDGLNIPDAARVAGIYKAFSKSGVEGLEAGDRSPMRRAVAFADNIAVSKHVRAMLDDNAALSKTVPRREADLVMRAHHVDGTMDILQRGAALEWLKGEITGNETRILTNARCLSEGVDVPALDAVVFLNPRRSVVDIVQSVGRVMRKAPGKQEGYIIIPVAIPAGLTPEQALDDNDRFKVVWQVLQALRAHDDRLAATIEAIRLNPRGERNSQVQVVAVDSFNSRADTDAQRGDTRQAELDFTPLGAEWTDAIYARLVRRCGERDYWENWASGVAEVAERQRARIAALLETRVGIRREFERFVKGLRANLNESISETDALDMLAQHLITEPVLEILFEGYSFREHNPVAKAMDRMLSALEGTNVDSETRELESFYAGVRRSVGQITDAQGKQKFLKQLYERFFRIAMRKAADRLGIVYTPNEIVDFILRSVDELMQEHFGKRLADEGVHILDPFTGTGTFLAQLILNPELMPDHALPHKFRHELWANEINLLAYYVAAANLEQAYRSRMGGNYVAFPGIALTDTFQNTEDGDQLDAEGVFEMNNAVVVAESAAPISVIVGNPPYSVGQSSDNDANKNLPYPTLDGAIRGTFGALTATQNKSKLFDSYIRAIRWALDRVGDSGVVAFVINNGFIEGKGADGLRKSLTLECDEIHIVDLRGNSRTAGETARREGGNVFGVRVGIALVFLVRKPVRGSHSKLYYFAMRDSASRLEKLDALRTSRLGNIGMSELSANETGDWLSHRSTSFASLTALSAKGSSEPLTLVNLHTQGVGSGRDAWVYNHSRSELGRNVERTIDAFNRELERWHQAGRPANVESFVDPDPHWISWTRSLRARLSRSSRAQFDVSVIRTAAYRPFDRQTLYWSREINHEHSLTRAAFPTSTTPNFGYYTVGAASAVPFSALMIDSTPDLHLTGAGSSGQFFPRYTYEHRASDPNQFDLGDGTGDEYVRVDNVTDGILAEYRQTYADPSISKDDIFFYVYGVLHSPEYRERFAADLKKMLPRIPKCRDFRAFAEAGRRLSELHLGYETIDPWPLEEVVTGTPSDEDLLHVVKMRYPSRTDRSAVVVNGHLTLRGIPETAHDYKLGSRSALDWILERYQIKTDKPSGIVNDPNDWGREHGQPRYIVDLVKRITRVSVETMAIVEALPALKIIGVDDTVADSTEAEATGATSVVGDSVGTGDEGRRIPRFR